MSYQNPYHNSPFFSMETALAAANEILDLGKKVNTNDLKTFINRAELYQKERSDKGFCKLPTITRAIDAAKETLEMWDKN